MAASLGRRSAFGETLTRSRGVIADHRLPFRVRDAVRSTKCDGTVADCAVDTADMNLVT